jgi:hypothetical protein
MTVYFGNEPRRSRPNPALHPQRRRAGGGIRYEYRHDDLALANADNAELNEIDALCDSVELLLARGGEWSSRRDRQSSTGRRVNELLFLEIERHQAIAKQSERRIRTAEAARSISEMRARIAPHEAASRETEQFLREQRDVAHIRRVMARQ